MDLISIIIPIYNTLKYLDACLNSVVKQSYNNLEIILVDDGSNDGSDRICDYYAKKDSRISVKHVPNGGLSSARNIGLDEAKGNFVAFVDSDDIIDKNYVKILYDACIKFKVDIAQCKMLRFDNEEPLNNDKKVFIKVSSYKTFIDEKISLSLYSDSVCDKLFKKILFDNIRFPIREIYEDGKTIIKIWLKTEKQAICDFFGYFYRITPNSILTTYNFEKNYEQVIVWENRAKLLEELEFTNNNIKELESRIMKHLLYQYFQVHKNKIDKNKKNILTKKIKEYIDKTKDNEFLHKRQKVLIKLYKFSKTLFCFLCSIYYKKNKCNK